MSEKEQQQQQHVPIAHENHKETAAAVAAAEETSAAVIFVPRDVGEDEDAAADDWEHVISDPPTPGDCRDEERAFLDDFEEHITLLLRLCRHHFPCRQKIQWTIEYGNHRKHTFRIQIKPPRSTGHH